MMKYTRKQLVEIAREAIAVPQGGWGNRDSSGAQRQAGECLSLLLSGCDFEVLREGKGGLRTDNHTIWLSIGFKGFGYFDGASGFMEQEVFYLPTKARLLRCDGGDWY